MSLTVITSCIMLVSFWLYFTEALSLQKSSRHQEDIEIVETFNADFQDYDPFLKDLYDIKVLEEMEIMENNIKNSGFQDNYYDPFLRDSYHKKLLGNIHKSQTNINSITCPELQNHTFTDAKPFDVLGLPKCGDLMNIEMKLYLDDANNSECGLDSYYLPNNHTTNCLDLLKNSVDEGKTDKVMIITHGFLNRGDTSWLHTMKNAIHEVENGTAVIILGWGQGHSTMSYLRDLFHYHQVAANVRYVSRALFLIMEAMHATVQRSLFTHCAGHSLGSHVCGLAGKLLKASNSSPMFNRISAMDPAGPLFYNDIPYPYNKLDITSDSRLSKHDAHLVDAIHTDGQPRFYGHIIQYGTLESVGHLDFYPGNGKGLYGAHQPGCNSAIDYIACSHSRAHQYYMASIKDASCLADKICHGDPKLYPDNCLKMIFDNQKQTMDFEVVMGYWSNKSKLIGGSYTVEICKDFPYCT